MLKEIETETYSGGDIKETGLSPAMKIVEELGKYAVLGGLNHLNENNGKANETNGKEMFSLITLK